MPSAAATADAGEDRRAHTGSAVTRPSPAASDTRSLSRRPPGHASSHIAAADSGVTPPNSASGPVTICVIGLPARPPSGIHNF